MEQFVRHTGTVVPLRRTDVDTDQIIPARFCASTSRSGHAAALFADWRTEPGFVLDRPERAGASILVAGTDFGTGSSREYAVWALQDHGFRVVVAPRFGDIFRANSLMNGLLSVTLAPASVEYLWELTEADPGARVTVDLERGEVRCAGLVERFTLDEDVRRRLLGGLDVIADTLRFEADIGRYEGTRRAALPVTRGRAPGTYEGPPVTYGGPPGTYGGPPGTYGGPPVARGQALFAYDETPVFRGDTTVTS
ncbi:3-isopropylmalate dehydratase small subunit [Streptomyces tsukubensis]|uniref:3-isopropylmalate dehydratase small subunit n=1 Tax=Streptomyces tsukubensis TaxID=83656 RepID=A0A1V4ACG1_9ACTN|nr:3-isopropylmalate dehydratase small subunit [Streptomyces tsukubensis]QFR94962.1 3-isopropylmalate dehydratase small subunit [Streptomyces tsukubensis]